MAGTPSLQSCSPRQRALSRDTGLQRCPAQCQPEDVSLSLLDAHCRLCQGDAKPHPATAHVHVRLRPTVSLTDLGHCSPIRGPRPAGGRGVVDRLLDPQRLGSSSEVTVGAGPRALRWRASHLSSLAACAGESEPAERTVRPTPQLVAGGKGSAWCVGSPAPRPLAPCCPASNQAARWPCAARAFSEHVPLQGVPDIHLHATPGPPCGTSGRSPHVSRQGPVC